MRWLLAIVLAACGPTPLVNGPTATLPPSQPPSTMPKLCRPMTICPASIGVIDAVR